MECEFCSILLRSTPFYSVLFRSVPFRLDYPNIPLENSSNRRKKKKLTTMKAPNPLSKALALAIAIILAISSSFSFVHCSSWQILTKHNFSSQIRLHPHVLLLVTVPWSGESRSLMKELSHIIDEKPQEFSNLKLMFIHMHMEKTLADSLGANVDGITVIYFHYSVSYKYRGRLAAKSILSSLHFYLSIAPEEVPLKTLNSARDFRTFLDY